MAPEEHIEVDFQSITGLPAATVCETWQRSRLERLRRYITRPPIPTKRLSVDGRGRVMFDGVRPCSTAHRAPPASLPLPNLI